MAETRRDRRAPVSLKVRFKSATVEQFLDQYSNDISKRGIFIKSRQPMDVGTLMKFEFQLKDETRIIQGIGRVVWKRTSDDAADTPSAPGMGIKFIKMDAASRRFVQEIVDKREGQPGRFDEGMATKTAGGGSFFPPGASEPPPPEDATSIRHASEFLAEALSKANAATAKQAEQGAKKAREATARVQAHREAVDAARRAREDGTGSITTERGKRDPLRTVATALPGPATIPVQDAPRFAERTAAPSQPPSTPPKKRQTAADILKGVEVIPPKKQRDDTAELFLRRATVAPPGEDDEFAEAERIELAHATKPRSRWTDPAARLKRSSAPIDDDDYLPVAKPKDLISTPAAKLDSLNETKLGVGPAPYDDDAETVVANSDKMTELIESARVAAAAQDELNGDTVADDLVERATASLVNDGDLKADSGPPTEKADALATGLMGLLDTSDEDAPSYEDAETEVANIETLLADAKGTTDVVAAGTAALDAEEVKTDAVKADVISKAPAKVEDATKKVSEVTETAAAPIVAPPEEEETGGGWIKWLLLVAAIGLAFLAWTKMNTQTVSPAIEPSRQISAIGASVTDAVDEVGEAVEEGATEAVTAVGEAAEAGAEAAEEAVAAVGEATEEAGAEEAGAAVEAMADEVVAEAPTEVEPAPDVEMVNVQIASTPTGASLTVNGQDVGRSPTVLELPISQVARVIVDADGYAAEEHTITPRANQNNRLAVRLDALPFILEVQTTPGDARVMAYRSAFTAPGEIRLRPFARYVPIIITKNGYQRVRQRILKEQFEERDGAMRYRLVVELEERVVRRRTRPTTTGTTGGMTTSMTTSMTTMTTLPDNPF